MKSNRTRVLILTGLCATIAAVPALGDQSASTGTVARYDIRAGTMSGMSAMGRSAGGVMGMMMGGGSGGNVQHELWLRLGSTQSASGTPKAEHFMPPSAQLGKSVLLTSPKTESRNVDQLPEKPKGRMLIFWGCGAHSPKDQPVVIDFSKLAAGQVPPGLWSSSITRDWGPNVTNSRSFGRWPSDDGKFVKANSSLLGAHKVISNYAPEIAFTASKDFMAQLQVAPQPNAGGGTLLSWKAIPDATGYLLFLVGGKQGPGGTMGDMVMWTSSASRQFGGGLADWLSPSQVSGLVRDKTVLPPSATSCVVPAEVRAAAPDFTSGTLTAFGPEEDFSYPPRPANAAKTWAPEWTARIRHRSTTNWIEAQGMTMGSVSEAEASPDAEKPAKKDCKPKKTGGIMGSIGAVVGSALGC